MSSTSWRMFSPVWGEGILLTVRVTQWHKWSLHVKKWAVIPRLEELIPFLVHILSTQILTFWLSFNMLTIFCFRSTIINFYLALCWLMLFLVQHNACQVWLATHETRRSDWEHLYSLQIWQACMLWTCIDHSLCHTACFLALHVAVSSGQD